MRRGPRVLAVEFLGEVFSIPRKADSIRRDRRYLRLSRRDRRLAMEIVLGVLRHRRRLDWCAERLSNRPLEQLDEAVLGILRSGLYQLDFLRAPERAVVHQAVELCSAFGKSSAKAFVNALLRRHLRERPQPPQGLGAAALAVRHSHPDWLVRRYLQRYPPRTVEDLLKRNNTAPRPPLWVNPFKAGFEQFQGWLKEEGIPFRVRTGLPNCLSVPSGFAGHRLYREGYCWFMDAASQQVAGRSDLRGRTAVGDFCAAPGGKSFLLAARLEPGSRLFCTDSSWPRLRRMAARARLCQIPLTAAQADLTRPAPFRQAFDFILLDVPCSGLGTLAANPDIRWKIQESDLESLAERQSAILLNAWKTLKPGGQLLYSTCSTEPEENEEVVQRLLEREPKARLEGAFRRTFPRGRGQCFFSALVGLAG